jgi:iron complex transport system ATP-binding protein
MDNQLLEIAGVSIGYHGNTLCSNIKANVSEGQLVLFLGANGKGKSTLIRSIAGLQKPISGKIKILGKDLSAYSLKDLAKQVSFLPASNEMVDGITVIELLSFSRIPFKTWFQNTNDQDMEVITKVAQQTGIIENLDKPYNTLSDGQKQKVNIARCLVQETPLILLDEPTAHLDIVNKIQIFELIKELTKSGKTFICVTHDIRDAGPYADQFWMIDNQNNFRVSENNSELRIEDIIAKLF